MQHTYLFRILQKFSEKDWTEFCEYVRSPYSAAAPLQLSLLAYLDQNHGKWWQVENDPPCLQPSAIYRHLYPGEADFRPQRLRRLASELHELVRKWTGFRTFRKRKPSCVRLDYLRFLLDRGAYPEFQKAWRQTVRQHPIDRPGEWSQSELVELHRMENEYRIHTGASEDSFESVQTALDRRYLAEKLETWASMHTREKRYPQRHRYSFPEAIQAMLAAAPLQEWSEVAIWAKVVDLESASASRVDYEELESLLFLHAGLLPVGKLRQVRGYMFNFLLRHIETDRREDYRKLWQLIRLMLQEGTLLTQGRLAAPFLRAAVQSACFAGEAEWASEFIAAHAGQVVGDDKEQILALHRLMVAYHLGKYKAVLRGSAILRHGDPRFEVQLRLLQLKTFFDLGEVEDGLRLVESTRKFIRRKRGLSARFQDACLQFLRLAERLPRLRPGDDAVRRQMEESIRKSEATEKLWLLGRVAGR